MGWNGSESQTHTESLQFIVIRPELQPACSAAAQLQYLTLMFLSDNLCLLQDLSSQQHKPAQPHGATICLHTHHLFDMAALCRQVYH